MIMIDLSTPEERGKRLKILIGMTSLNRKEFGEKYDFSQTTLNYWENARQGGLSEKGAKKIIAAVSEEGIEVTVTWLMFGIGSLPKFKQNIQHETYNVETNKNFLEQTKSSISDEIDLFKKNNLQAIIMPITDNGMEPLFKIGDIVGGVKNNIKDSIEQDCIIALSESKLICRRLFYNSETNMYNLSCINNSTEIVMPVIYNVDIKYSAPVIRLWRNKK